MYVRGPGDIDPTNFGKGFNSSLDPITEGLQKAINSGRGQGSITFYLQSMSCFVSQLDGSQPGNVQYTQDWYNLVTNYSSSMSPQVLNSYLSTLVQDTMKSPITFSESQLKQGFERLFDYMRSSFTYPELPQEAGADFSNAIETMLYVNPSLGEKLDFMLTNNPNTSLFTLLDQFAHGNPVGQEISELSAQIETELKNS